MNAPLSSPTPYRKDLSPSRDLKSIEYDLLARVTQKLKLGLRDRDKDLAGLAQALLDNQRLWTTFASDVASEGNELPSPLRAQIFYLCEFTLQHSAKVLARTASGEVLIDINTAVMRGLRGRTGEGT